MKKVSILILNSMFILLFIAGCSNSFDVKSTNLSNVTIDNLMVDSKQDEMVGNIIENKNNISVNGVEKLTNINEVTDILGNNFKGKWYDKEQGLMAHEYHDNTNNIKAIFIYSNYDEKLVWLKLSKINI